MGINPTVTVLVNIPLEDDNDNREEIIPTLIEIVDKNTIILVFERQYSGIAQLIGQQSDPDILTSQNSAVTTTDEAIQLSNDGLLTIATKILTTGNDPTLTIDIGFSSGDDNYVDPFIADDQPPLTSPWASTNRVVIEGKMFIVRSIQLSNITNGTTLIFDNNITSTDDVGAETAYTVGLNDIVILMAKSPFTSADRTYQQYVDVFSVNETENAFGLVFNNGEVFAVPTLIINPFPYIKIVNI